MIKLFQRHRSLIGWLVFIVFLVSLYGDPKGWFLYQRHEIFLGEYWRLITGNFVHATPIHFLLNLVALILIGIYGRECPARFVVGSLVFCSFGVGLGLLWFAPLVESYWGVSGILHGLLTTVTCFYLYKNLYDYFSWLVLFIVLLKVIYEGVSVAPTPTAELIDTVVIYQAHLFGAVSGIAYCILSHLLGYTLRNKKARPS